MMMKSSRGDDEKGVGKRGNRVKSSATKSVYVRRQKEWRRERERANRKG